MNKLVLMFLIIIILPMNNFAQEEQQFNPADPTEAATNIVIIPEYDKADDYKAYGLRINYDRDWGEGVYSINVEAGYGKAEYTDGKIESGFTDIRTRFFWKIYDNEGAALRNMVFNLDMFIPVGDVSKGFGIGTFEFVPGVIFSFPVSNKFTIYPNPRLSFSTGKTTARTSAFPPGRNPLTPRPLEEEYIFAFEIETFFTYEFEVGTWAFIAPIINWDFIPEPNEENYEVTTKLQFGKMFGHIGIGAETTFFVAGEKSQDLQAKLMFYYYL